MRTETTVEIDRPIEEVFEYSLNNVVEWSLTCVEDEVLEDRNDGGVGTRFRIVTEENGRKMPFEGVVTRHEPPRESAIHLDGQFFEIDVHYLFEDLDGRTRVTQRSVVGGKGFVKVMFTLFGWAIKGAGCKTQENELQSLKRHCEERARESG